MFVELTEYNKGNNSIIGPFLVDTDLIKYIDTYPENDINFFRVALKDSNDTRFFIHEDGYNLLKHILTKSNEEM